MKEYDLTKILFSLSGNQINEGILEYYIEPDNNPLTFINDGTGRPIFNRRNPDNFIHCFNITVMVRKNPDSPYMLLVNLLDKQIVADFIDKQEKNRKTTMNLVLNDNFSTNINFNQAVFVRSSESGMGSATFLIKASLDIYINDIKS